MAEPELWTRHADEPLDDKADAELKRMWGLVRVSFDDMVERMARFEYERGLLPSNVLLTDETWAAASRETRITYLDWARPVLRAALGEGT